MLRDPPHYLPRLTTTKTPKRLLWLDCATSTAYEQGAYVDRWASGALGTTHWTSKRGERRDTLTAYDDAQALWQAADGFCRPNRRVVLWAHDLAYQLRVSQALVHLPLMGWHLDRIVLERTAAWALFRSGKRTLMMCDLKSWTPLDLEVIRADLQLDGAQLDVDNHGAGVGAYTTTGRASVIREACLQIFTWIEGESLGPFRPTGSGQSYAAFRRRFLSHKLLVHDDVERLHVERVAMWTGRCEAWRHGSLDAGPFTEYDMRAAYCQIAAECAVPAIASQVMRSPSLERAQAAMQAGALLAECEISTSVPVVPARLGERTVWPVGTFKTVLWDPELQLAMTHADRVKITRAWRYHTQPALQGFATFVLDGLDAQTTIYGQVPARVLKHWSRCLVGRLGLRYRQWQRFGTCPEPDLRLVTYIDVDAGTSTDLLCAGQDRLILTGMVEAMDSLPQVPGWVMSECRRRLWVAMVNAGLENVIYLDTDSLIIGPAAARLGRTPITNGQSRHWTIKGRYDRMVVHGPRNLVTQSGRRVSGLPLRAVQVAPLEFTGQVMRSIKESMRAGELDHVASLPRRFVLDAPDLRRQHCQDGTTIPYHLEAKDASTSSADL